MYINGKPKIADAELADQEWAKHTDLTKAPTAVKEDAAQRQDVKADSPITPPGVNELTLAGAAADEKRWKAKRAELDFRREAGELVDAEAVAAMYVEEVIRARTKILAVPNKLKARAPELAPTTLRILDDLLRQALEELAEDASSGARAAQQRGRGTAA